MFLNNCIVLTSENIKKQILLNRDELVNVKIYSINEFKNLYYKSTTKTLSYIKNKYSVTLEIAKIYLDNLFYIVDKKYNNEKLDFLVKLKKDLIKNNYLKLNQNFINFLTGKKIYFYNLKYEKDIEKLKNLLNKISSVSILNDNINNFNHKIYSFDEVNIEVAYVAEEICKLVKRKINLNNIYLVNLDDDYREVIKNIFPMFNLPFSLNDKDTLYNTNLAIEFLNHFDLGVEKALEYISNLVKSKEDEAIYNLIVDIINKYIDLDEDLYDMIKYTFKKTKIKGISYKECIKETSVFNKFLEEDYVFMLNFSNNTPRIYKDEDYLSNIELKILGLNTTDILNKQEKLKYIDAIKNIYNLILTNSILDETNKISILNDTLDYEVIKKEEFISLYSDLYNKMELAKELDLFYKFKTIYKNLIALYNHYQDADYKNYDHSFKGINKDDLKQYLNNSLTLSYSSLDKYYRCPFSFYINNILKLDKYEDTFYQVVGRIFHYCLEKYDLPFLEVFEKAKNRESYDFNKREEFFLELLKEELRFVINSIKSQNTYSTLDKELHEQKICVVLNKEIKVNFVGIIDKIKFKEEDNKTYVAIIDYKTGLPNISLSLIKYGLGMQLPIYLYLIKNYEKLKNSCIVGLYLQKVVNEKVAPGINDYCEEKRKNLLLQGYSNSDIKVLEKFDNTFINSKLIKGMKLKKDNNFYSYSKVLSDEHFDYIYNITLDNINKGIDNILNGEFKIEPKRINKENYGCSFCKFRDICFCKESDIKDLKELKLEDILEGL